MFVDTDGPVPGLAEQVRDGLPNAVDVVLRYERLEQPAEARPVSTLQPREQFMSYYRREHHVDEVPQDLLGAFDRVLDDVGQEG